MFDQCCVCKLYADDLKLYMHMSIAGYAHTFQKCTDNLTLWSRTWQFDISHQKCSVLQLGIVANDCDYYIESVPVGQVDIVKDLGVVEDKCFKFDRHINNIVECALVRANLIHKISQCRTAVLHCCKGDAASQWEWVLWVSELCNP